MQARVREILKATIGAREKDYVRFPEFLDIHVPRMLEANRVAPSYMADSDLLRSGLIRIDKFLDDEKLVSEVLEQIRTSPVRDMKDKDSTVALLANTPAYEVMDSLWKVIRVLFREHMLEELSKLFSQNTYLQHLLNSPDDGDEQKVFHSDTFFHCVKFWYFPHEVRQEDGAFWYVPYSPILTTGLVDWHLQRVADLKNGRAEEWRGIGHKEGSFRISVEELKRLYLTPVPVEVDPDTLVVANVFGFHGRGNTVRPTHRLSIHGSIRVVDPFAH